MITKYDLDQAIAECQGVRDPNANTCIKLAAYYTIRQAMFGDGDKENAVKMIPQYSYATGPAISYTGDSEFASIINGRDPNSVWAVMDELMVVVQVTNPKLYSAVIMKLKGVPG